MSGQRKALIIANDDYEQEVLQNLLAPEADAEALGRVLGDRQIGDFGVQVVRNQPSYIIGERIEDLFVESRPDDVLLLHFSGHGLKSESGELFFAASNTHPSRLRSTAVPAEFVQRCMRDSRSRSIVLLLDCCYGGAFAQGVKVRAAGDINVLDSFPQGRSGGGRGRAVITASTAMEYAFEGDRLSDDHLRRPSVFTSALVQGLATGDADQDEDGLVSLSELYEYIFDKVREQNPHQTPSRQVELEGELYLARSQRRRIRPAAIPADLQAAVSDQNMYTRRGAVSELHSRLASEDLPVAMGAYEVLTEVARTDIQYVADLAAAALSEAVVRPEKTEVHFGERREGTEAPHQLVRLSGLPIARACASRVSHEWIRVSETTEGLDIWIDTASTGTLRGSVDLKGPTGAAVIAVDVDLLPREAPTSSVDRTVGSADKDVAAPAGPPDRPKGQSSGEDHPVARRAANRKAAEEGDQNAAETIKPQVTASDRATEPTPASAPSHPDEPDRPRSEADILTPLAPVPNLISAPEQPPPQEAGAVEQPRVVLSFQYKTGSLNSFALSADGHWLATSGSDGTVKIWDPATGEQHLFLKTSAGALMFSRDGRWLVTYKQGAAQIWDTISGQSHQMIHHRGGSANTVALTADGRWLATAGRTHNSVRIWETTDGQELRSISAGQSPTVLAPVQMVGGLAFSPDGRWLATASSDKTARIWDAATGRPVLTLTHGSAVLAVAFNRDSHRLGTVSGDKTAHIWDTATGRPLLEVSHGKSMSAVAFSADNRWLATAGSDKTARVWDTATGEMVKVLGHDKPVWGVAFHPDGNHLVTASKPAAQIWTLGPDNH